MTDFRQEYGGGQSISYVDTDGYITNSFGAPKETAKRILEMAYFKCRPDDVFICAPVKSGDVGDWKNWFTLAQNEHFNKVYNEKMAVSKHEFKYERKRKNTRILF